MRAASHRIDAVPAPALVLAAAVSVQSGAALADRLFATVGPLGAVWLRLALSALVLCLVSRPTLRDRSKSALLTAVAFGLVLTAMNTTFYLAIDRIPLGPAVTVEFIGPLAVAVSGSRRALDLLWVGLAAAGVVLLAGVDRSGHGGHSLDPVGLGFAALAGVCWAGYIVASQRVGRHFSGSSGLTIALVVGAVCLTPFALIRHGSALAHPHPLLVGLAIAMLSSALPYSFELAALRRLRAATFGVLLSLDPAVAALSGLVLLGQHLRWSEWLALAFVVTASAAASLTGHPPEAGPEPVPPAAETAAVATDGCGL